MMFTDGKTLTDLTAMSFYMLDVCSPTIFSWFAALVGAHFPTFRIGVLCDGNGIMLGKKIPLPGDLGARPARTGGQDR